MHAFRFDLPLHERTPPSLTMHGRADNMTLGLNAGTVRLPHVHGRADRAGGKAIPVVGHLASSAKHESVGYSQHASSPPSQGGYHALLLVGVVMNRYGPKS